MVSSEWRSFEVIHKNSKSTPVSDAITGSDTRLQVLQKMSLVERHGWPDAKELKIGGKEGKKRIVKKSDPIWLLKCTPSCWRLYFYVIESAKRIVYLHAVCKKKDKEDSGDEAQARAAFERITSARAGIAAIEFPTE